jgi:hypothetical protein
MTGKERYRPNKSASSNASSDSPPDRYIQATTCSRLGAPIWNRAMKIPVGSKQRSVWLTPPQLLLERVAKGDSEDPELSMKKRLYTRLSDLKPQALRLLRTVNREGITISRLTACMDFRTWPRMVLKSWSQMVTRVASCGSHATLSLHAVRQLLPRCRDALRG